MGLRPKPPGDDRVSDVFTAEDLIWIPENTFCCLCSWWHDPNVVSDHEPMLCPTCLDDYLSDRWLRKRDAAVTPAPKKRVKKAG